MACQEPVWRGGTWDGRDEPCGRPVKGVHHGVEFCGTHLRMYERQAVKAAAAIEARTEARTERERMLKAERELRDACAELARKNRALDEIRCGAGFGYIVNNVAIRMMEIAREALAEPGPVTAPEPLTPEQVAALPFEEYRLWLRRPEVKRLSDAEFEHIYGPAFDAVSKRNWEQGR